MMLGFGFSKTRVFLPLCHMILRKFLNFSKLQSDDNNDIYSTAVVLGKTRETMCANCILVCAQQILAIINILFLGKTLLVFALLHSVL